MGYTWNHNYVDGDDLADDSIYQNFRSALNERLAGLGMNQIPVQDTIGQAFLWNNKLPGVVEPVPSLSSVGVKNWKAIEDSIYALAQSWYTNHALFNVADTTTWTDWNPSTSDYNSWPRPNGFTCKRELEITNLGVGMADGTRARFLYSTVPFYSDFLSSNMAASSFSELQYATKIMKRQSGVWIVDPDQTTPLVLQTYYGRTKIGDIYGPWIPNERRDALNRLDSFVVYQFGPDSSWPTGPASNGYLDVYKRGPFSAFIDPATGVPYSSAAGAQADVDAQWAASAEVISDISNGTPYTGAARNNSENANTAFNHNTFFGRDEWQASMKAVKVRVNAPGFQGVKNGTVKHTMQSTVDEYWIVDGISTGGTPCGFTPRGHPGLTQTVTTLNWNMVGSIGPSHDDVRQGQWYGDTATEVPWATAPGCSGSKLDRILMFQKFNVAGGFQYLP